MLIFKNIQNLNVKFKNKNIEKEKPIIENKPEENQNKKEPIIEEKTSQSLENKKLETPRKITAKTNGGNPFSFKDLIKKWNKDPVETKQIIEPPKENIKNNPNNVLKDEIKAPLNHKENKEIPQIKTKQIFEKPKVIVQNPLNNAQNEIKNPLNHHKNKEISEKLQEKENIPNKLENNQEIKQITSILPPPKENGNNQQNKLGKKPKGKKQKRKNARKGKGKKRNKNKKNKNKNKKNNNGKGGGNKPSRKRRNKNRRKNKNKPNQINNTPLHEMEMVQGLKKGQKHPNGGKKQAEVSKRDILLGQLAV